MGIPGPSSRPRWAPTEVRFRLGRNRQPGQDGGVRRSSLPRVVGPSWPGEPPDGTGVLVAVSGGCDSVHLLHALADRVRGGCRWRLVVGHFNHRWRGAASDADEAWVTELAGQLGFSAVVGRAPEGAVLRDAGESREARARAQRHEFLAGMAVAEGCAAIATGHHADDQMELFLWRLLRGAGGGALGGMEVWDPPPVRGGVPLWRPQLGLTRTEIEERTRAFGCGWREDATNLDTACLRNRVRHELMPLLVQRFQPGLGPVLARTQDILREQARHVETDARTWLAQAGTSCRASFRELSVAVQREVIRAQLDRLGVEGSFDRIEALRLQPGKILQVGPLRWILRTEDAGVVEGGPEGVLPPFDPAGQGLRLDAGRVAGEERFGGGLLEWRLEPAGGTPTTQDAGEERLDADAVGPYLRLRHWRPGDRFRPIGGPAEVKLQDLFTNAKVPAVERRRRVVAETEGGRIFWVEGLRIGEAARRTVDTSRVLVWRWRREAA